MLKRNRSRFSRESAKTHKNFSIHGPWAGVALALIAIAQLPLALKATLEIVCLSESTNKNDGITWCKKL